MNIRALILLLITCCLISAGCQREAAIPGDSFRLTVERIITERDTVVSLLKIHVPHNASISLASEFYHCTVNLANSPGDTARVGQVALTASRITRQGDRFAYIQTLIGANQGGTNFGGCSSAVKPVPAATTLDAYFSVTAASGDYKLNTPIQIGRMDGKPVTLVVGQPAQ